MAVADGLLEQRSVPRAKGCGVNTARRRSQRSDALCFAGAWVATLEVELTSFSIGAESRGLKQLVQKALTT